MVDEEVVRRGSALRQRQRVILLCAPVTMLFSVADFVALGRFSVSSFFVRIAWSAIIVASALMLPRLGPAAERHLMMFLAVTTSLFFGVLTELTGGVKSPLYQWVLVMPLIVAVVLQEFPHATLGAAVATLLSGNAITWHGGHTSTACVQWSIQDLAISTLAVYASITYRRLRFREQALREAAVVASERARAADHAVETRDEFLSIASHELKTPITALKLQAERLLRRARQRPAAGDVDVQRESLELVNRQTDRLIELVESLLDVSRLTDGHAGLQLVPTDLGTAVRQAVQRLTPLAESSECPLVLDLPVDVAVQIDRTRFEQVLGNVLGNAFKYGGGRPVRVVARVQDGQVRVSIQDQGIGVATEDQERIFERFERAASTQNYGGLGLGLWISRRLMQQMHGRISVQSQPGDGATFTLELPVARVTASVAPAERESSPL